MALYGALSLHVGLALVSLYQRHHFRMPAREALQLLFGLAIPLLLTSIVEHKLPYDVVFLLNRYFDAIGTAIELAGGIANQFTGDGVMAWFGIQTGPDEGCRQAPAAGAPHRFA
jgi:hypothetical protein